MTMVKTLRLLLAFAVVFSLSSLPGPSSSLTFPLPSVHANSAPAQFWTPGGASSNTFLATMYSGEGPEFSALLGQQIDFMDSPLTPAEISCLNNGSGCPGVNPANYYVTSPIGGLAEFEIEFNLANTGQTASATVLNSFWGIPMQFGNSLKGIHIRQGVDHLVDRAAFVRNDASLGGYALAIDNPVSPFDGLVSPNTCSWDPLFPQTGAGCAVGPSYVSGTTVIDTGGTAYHLGGNTVMPGGVGVWQPGPGSPDLNAAAAHFVAAGIATGFNSATSVLTGLNATAVANPPTFFIRNDNFPRLDLGTSIAQEICYLFTGSISLTATSCAAGPGLNLQFIPIATAVSLIFTTPTAGLNQGWGFYTAGFGGVFPFDSLLFFEYNSQFTDNGSGALTGTPCTSTTTSTSASNYMYVCVPAYDSISSQMEFAPCLSAAGDPVAGQITPTFATCSGTTSLTAVSAGYKTEDLYGRSALTLPMYVQKEQFGYLSNENIGVTNSAGAAIPQFFTWLNAWNPTPRAGTGQLPFVFRQGFKQTTTSLTPYQASTVWDFFVLGDLFDSIYASNPFNTNQFFNWMTTSSQVICSPTSTACSSSALGYVPPSGTVAVIRSVLKNGQKWQDGSPLNAWDIRFSYLTLKAAGAFQSSVEAPLLDVHMISTLQFDFDLNAIGPFTQLTIGGPTIFPGHVWSSCGASTWNAAAPAGDPTMTGCSGASGLSRTFSGAKFDALASGLLIGSSAWTCANTGAATAVPIGTLGTGCSSTDTQAPGVGGTITLTRQGCTLTSTGTSCGIPGTSPYFRSSSNVAAWIWSGMNGNFIHDFVNLSGLAACFGKAAGTTGCGQWQSGIGNPADAPPSFPCVTSHCIGLAQYSAVSLLLSVSLVAAAPNAPGSAGAWTDFPGIATGSLPSPSGDGVPAPVLYEGANTLNPASVAGCTTSYTNGSPSTGGYDC